MICFEEDDSAKIVFIVIQQPLNTTNFDTNKNTTETTTKTTNVSASITLASLLFRYVLTTSTPL